MMRLIVIILQIFLSIAIKANYLKEYDNLQIRKINEFEFLIENADIDIARNNELMGGDYGRKQQRQKQFRMRVPVRILANDLCKFV